MSCLQEGLPPSGYNRYGHTCTYIRNGMLLWHAGAINYDNGTIVDYSTTYMFDPGNNHFSRVNYQPEMDARRHHAVAYVDLQAPSTDRLYLYGGIKNVPIAYFNDLWMMDTNVQGKKSKS